MNKKLLGLLGLFLVVGALLVFVIGALFVSGDVTSDSSGADQLSEGARTQYAIDCQGDNPPCTISGENRYWIDIGDENTETVTVRDNGVIIRESTATN
ncbi:MAG TPA: hypothetical protein VJC21_03730, partial [Candidatus Nanoarchaeia archaeon]|nr:hypothetical protein [Candidatus Nanoarchaeia archaeon]